MSLSREFAGSVAGLQFEDLPRAVVDRAKGVTLQALSSALVAHDMPATRQALAIMREEEAGGGGVATALCSGEKFTKAGAAFINADDLRRRQMGYVPDADPSRHRHHARRARRRRGDRLLGQDVPNRHRRRL